LTNFYRPPTRRSTTASSTYGRGEPAYAAMVPLTREALLAQRERQAEQRAAAGDGWNDTGYVFTTRTGRPSSRAT
jgi:hypothetical protein